jgi:hypothetical protein
MPSRLTRASEARRGPSVDRREMSHRGAYMYRDPLPTVPLPTGAVPAELSRAKNTAGL